MRKNLIANEVSTSMYFSVEIKVIKKAFITLEIMKLYLGCSSQPQMLLLIFIHQLEKKKKKKIVQECLKANIKKQKHNCIVSTAETPQQFIYI